MHKAIIVILIQNLWILLISTVETTNKILNNCMDEQCTYCKAGHFLFELPQDNHELQLKAQQTICVECPLQEYISDEDNLYCGDCLDNSQTWNWNRVCSYDYKTSSTRFTVFHKTKRISKELFYVVQSESTINLNQSESTINTNQSESKINTNSTKYQYKTVNCQGCDHFCQEKSQNCFLVPKEFQYDTNNLYHSCKEGYEFDEERQICQSCPLNCLSCYQNSCLICNQGFSKLITRESSINQTTSVFCIPCFEKCTNCYLGKNNTNLNIFPWDQYNNLEGLYTQDFLSDQIKYFETLFNTYGITQRCVSCESTSQLTFIPSLNRRSCVKCGTKCRRCEYYSYWLKQKPSQNDLWIVEPQNKLETQELLESQYVLRCRECFNFNQIFNAIGTKCSDCNIINCALCHKTEIQSQSKLAFSTLTIDFEPQLPEDGFTEKCLICEDGYYLTESGICLLFDAMNKPTDGCLTFERQYNVQQCRKCQQGYILLLQQQTWVCEYGCEYYLQDPNCQSCIKQDQSYRCQICKVGYYVDVVTKKCQPCQRDGYCLKCYTLTMNVVHHPEYYNTVYEEDSQTNPIFGPFCYQCIPKEDDDIQNLNENNVGIGPFLNEDLRVCEKGGKKCQQFLARGKDGFCNLCINPNFRSSSEDGDDCIDCPNLTQGCRIRSQDEINQLNRFYNPSEGNNIYSTLAFQCSKTLDSYLDTRYNRCIQTTPKIERLKIIYANADCSINQDQFNQNIWQINRLYQEQKKDDQLNNNKVDKSLSKNATIIIETKSNVNIQELYSGCNKNVTNKIIINLQFSSADQNCFFQKDTYFTTDLKKEVFSAQEIELNISVEKDQKINWYLQSNIYFEYFSKVTISGINIQPAVDCEIFPQIQKLKSPFSFQFIQNDGLIIKLENVSIYNSAAFKFYSDKSLYTTPQSQQSIQKKKFTPFYFIFANLYDLQLVNVLIQSLNYLILEDTNLRNSLFGFVYDSQKLFPYFSIQVFNVKFQDLGIEDQAIFDLAQINIKKIPQINIKINISTTTINDVYFRNGGGFLSTKVNNSLEGLIEVSNVIINNTRFNNSRGIINFNNIFKIKVFQFTIVNSFVNRTNLFHITNIEIANSYVNNTQFNHKGKFIQTQHELQTNRQALPKYQILLLKIQSIKFEKVICSSPQCLISISEIKNDYIIPINITLKNVEISQINSYGFDLKIMNAATSAAIKIEKSYSVQVVDFLSEQNSNVSILYVDQVWNSKFININCQQITNLKITNNYCIFINNPYKSVKLYDIKLFNLNGQDNSFIVVSSWNNLIYNTTTQDYEEQIRIEQLLVQNCTITTTQPGISSSAIIIQSTQIQKLQLGYMKFISNQHFMTIPGSLSPSNPTLLIQSSLGQLQLLNSQWIFNSVQGFGATLYIEAGIQNISKINMSNNNDPYSRLNSDRSQIVEGGQLMIISYQAIINNCVFQNSTAKQGGSVYIKTQKEGMIQIMNTQFLTSSTQINYQGSSQGGCLYIDSKASQLNMTIIKSNFENCLSRQEGGAIYILSHSSESLLLIQDTYFSNCHSLSGAIVKANYDRNQLKVQQTRMTNVNIYTNQQQQEDFFAQLEKLTETEKYQFLIRNSAIEQDYGQLILMDVKYSGYKFYGFLSIKYPSLIKLTSIIAQDSVLSYNPLIEIIEPIGSNVVIEIIKFANISSISLDNKNCQLQKYDMTCMILQIRVDFIYLQIRPSLMLVDLVTPKSNLTLRTILINKVKCSECIHGLVQIARVSNMALEQLVLIDQCRCTDTITAYYGCFTISTQSYFKLQTDQDQLFNFTFQSNLTQEAIMNYTGIIPSKEQQNVVQSYQRILEVKEDQYYYVIPNPPYKAHIFIKSIFLQNNICIHGCGLAIYQLTTNITNAYCTQNNAKGMGAFLYFESNIQQRVNLAWSNCFNNQASIGGCLAVFGVHPNDLNKAKNQISRNLARIFGDNVNLYPYKLIILVNQVEQKNILLENGVEIVLNPILMQSGYTLNSYKNQSIQIQFVDEENKQIKHQYFSNLKILTDTVDNNSMGFTDCEIYPVSNNTKNDRYVIREFSNEIQGFQLSNLQIFQNPNLNKEINLTFTSDHIKKPVYVDSYPYAFQEYSKDIFNLKVKFQSIHCRYGEYYVESKSKCIPCYINFYSLKPNVTFCKSIDFEKMNHTQGFNIFLKDGFWRPNPYNDQVEKCYQNQKNCVGGLNVGNQQCTTGSIGALCEECDIHMVFWDNRYSKNWHSKCEKCGLEVASYFVIFTQILMILLLGWIAQMHSVRLPQYSVSRIYGIAKIGFKQQEFPQTLIILINYFQISSFLRFYNLDYESFQNFIGFVSFSMPALSLKIHLQCILNDNFYENIFWTLMIVIFGFLICIFIFLILKIVRLAQISIFIHSFFILVFIYIQPSYIIELIQLIRPRKISGQEYIQANVSYLFENNSQYEYYIVLSSLLLITIVPIIICVYFYYINFPLHYKKLKIMKKWAIFYIYYSKKALIFEFILRQLKLLVFIFITQFEQLYALIPIYCMLNLRLSFYIWMKNKKIKTYPYTSYLNNKLEDISHAINILSFIISTLFQKDDWLYIILISINAIYLLQFFNILLKKRLIHIYKQCTQKDIQKYLSDENKKIKMRVSQKIQTSYRNWKSSQCALSFGTYLFLNKIYDIEPLEQE